MGGGEVSDQLRKVIDHAIGRGGIRCHCCGSADNTVLVRAAKRRERRWWKKEAARSLEKAS